jgi:D-alanyl-lipoteichoic acid acyltransferase DltB (MBOAT superfamily)
LLFNSFRYLFLFLPAVLLLVALGRKFGGARAAQACVLVASIVFYGAFRPLNLLYLGGSIVCNWLLARRIGAATQPQRKRWLLLGLFANIAFLSTFKYVNFLFGTLPFMHGHEHLIPDLEFPLGISFFTLAQLMYLVDCYEKLIPPAQLFDYATFVSFFPYVISGPIAKAKRMMHQFGQFGDPAKRAQRTARGLFLFSLGLFKKCVFASTFAMVANWGFDASPHRSAAEAWIFSLAYALQLYFDFSGYSDMAIGTAEMLGVEVPRNFDAPFRSLSIIEFWQRWHISLSNFITGYMYTPLLRAFRKPTLAAGMLSTLLAMTVAGLWHGPAWTFVFFGLAHGIALATNQFWRKRVKLKLPAPVSLLVNLLFVLAAFVFFRSPNLPSAFAMLHEMVRPYHAFGMQNMRALHAGFSIPMFGPPLLLGLVVAFVGRSSEQRAREFTPSAQNALLAAAAVVVACIYMNSQLTTSFIYFKF